MSATARLARQLDEAYSGEPWHGPALRPLLQGLTATAAARKPIDRAHSIWELVLHLTAWKDVVRERLEGQAKTKVPPGVDWPPVTERNQAAWQAALEELDRAHQRLVRATGRLPEAYLERVVVGSRVTYGETLRGVALHDVYHAGQIAILAKVSRA